MSLDPTGWNQTQSEMEVCEKWKWSQRACASSAAEVQTLTAASSVMPRPVWLARSSSVVLSAVCWSPAIQASLSSMSCSSESSDCLADEVEPLTEGRRGKDPVAVDERLGR